MLSKLLKERDSCLDKLSTNGNLQHFSSVPSFALSLSKGGRRVFSSLLSADYQMAALKNLRSLLLPFRKILENERNKK